MRWWPRPSLARRVVVALLTAFLLVWLVLVGRDFIRYKAQLQGEEQAAKVARVFESILDAEDEERARIVMGTTERLINRSRDESDLPAPGDVALVLERPDGTPVYASAPLAGRRIPGAGESTATVMVDGRRYWSVVHATSRWRMQYLEPLLDDRQMLRFLGRQLLPSMLIAFPFVLLPVWLAVRRGLAPLRLFAARVEARPENDFSPLGARLVHAELQPLGAAIEALLAKARQGIARERAFVQDAAHELRTPLAVVVAQAHLLASAEGPAQRAEARAALELAVARASHLVGQLLTLAALEGGIERGGQRVDLVGLARDILIAHGAQAAAKSIDLGLDSPDRLESAQEPALFHSILGNLLANAIAYCPAGARVAVTLGLEAGQCRLVVADDGPGIAEADRPRVFERFFRGRDLASHGSGLGLAIVRQAVQRLGGAIEMGEGLAGRGVRFEVSFRCAGEGSATP